jgi:hypothetical protein
LKKEKEKKQKTKKINSKKDGRCGSRNGEFT